MAYVTDGFGRNVGANQTSLISTDGMGRDIRAFVSAVAVRVIRGPWSIHGSLHKARNIVKREVK